jgi:hypothetical protein
MSTETPQAPAEVQRMDPKLYPVAAFAWIWVLIPISYGVWKLFEKIPDLF